MTFGLILATRYTFVTRWAANCANVVCVQKQFQHSTIQFTVDTDTHWLEEAERNRWLVVARLVVPSKATVAPSES